MLRGINVGGHRIVSMDQLKKIYTSLGLQNVMTYVQSGNVIFSHPSSDPSALAKQIGYRLAKDLGFDIPVVIRTRVQMQKIADRNPFISKDLSKMHFTFLSDAPKQTLMYKIIRAVGPDEAFSVVGSEVYLFCPNGYGQSKLSNALFEGAFKVSATTRNWKTVQALVSMAKTQ